VWLLTRSKALNLEYLRATAAAFGVAASAIARGGIGLGVEAGAAALSPAEVAEVRARHPDKSAQSTRALRPATDL
jgi:hypothetical protein